MAVTVVMHPKDTPLDQWSAGWLTMEVASLIDMPGFLLMRDSERTAAGFARDPR